MHTSKQQVLITQPNIVPNLPPISKPCALTHDVYKFLLARLQQCSSSMRSSMVFEAMYLSEGSRSCLLVASLAQAMHPIHGLRQTCAHAWLGSF